MKSSIRREKSWCHLFKTNVLFGNITYANSDFNSCDNVAVSDFLKFSFLWETSTTISAMTQQREWFGHFPTSYVKINSMKNSLKFSKTVWCNSIKKINFVYAIIHHVLQWFFPFILSVILSNRSIYVPELALISTHLDY